MTTSELLSVALHSAVEAGKAILDVYNSHDFKVEIKSDKSPLTKADKQAHQIISEHLVQTGLPVLSEESEDISFQTRKYWKQFWLVDPLDGTKEFINRNGEFTVNIALIDNQMPVLGIIYVPVKDILYFGDSDSGAFYVENASKHVKESGVDPSALTQLPQSQHTTYGIVASRSHLNAETSMFIDGLLRKHPDARIITKGSSLKLCMIADGEADIYPRFGPTSEWDIAAGHAIVLAAGGVLKDAGDNNKPIVYNKENLLNPWFIAYRESKF